MTAQVQNGRIAPQDMTREQLMALVAAYKARESQPRKLTLKVSEKGGVSVYGMGKWPVTLYRDQWTRLLDEGDTIRAFLVDNADLLSDKVIGKPDAA